MEQDETIKHEAFAQIRFSRTNGHAKFYGSDLEQNNYITMEVHHSEIQRSLSQDWYFDRGAPIIKLRMSSGQFSEMITSMNVGSGVCCTLEFSDGKKVESLPEVENRKEFVLRKFKERMQSFADKIRKNKNEVIEIVKKKSLSKQDIHDLTTQLNYLTSEIESNIPFFSECFQENMDEVVLEAKIEIENAINHKITTLGLEALHNENKLLSDNNKNKDS